MDIEQCENFELQKHTNVNCQNLAEQVALALNEQKKCKMEGAQKDRGGNNADSDFLEIIFFSTLKQMEWMMKGKVLVLLCPSLNFS